MRHWLARHVFAAALFSLLTVSLLVAAGFGFSAVLVLAVFLTSLLIFASGKAILALPHAADHPETTLSESFVAGFTFLSLGTLLLIYLLPITAGVALLFCAAIELVALLLIYSRWGSRRTTSFSDSAPELVFMVLCFALVCFFCRRQIVAFPELLQTGIFHPWGDHIVHGAAITQFGSPEAVGRGDLLQVGRPWPFYHYGMFMIPAALMAVPDAPPGIALSVSAMYTFGLLIAILGCFTLIRELAGSAAAMFGVAGVMLLPDAAMNVPGNGFFGFHWLMTAVPGSGFGVGVGALALVFLLRWRHSRDLKQIAMCLVLTLATAMFRAQVFVLVGLIVVPYLAYCLAPKKWLAVALAGLLVLTPLIYLADAKIPLVYSHLHLNQNLDKFLVFVYLSNGPNPLESFARTLFTEYAGLPSDFAALVGLPMLIFGPWLLFLLGGVALLRVKKRLRATDALPAFICLAYALLVLFAGMPSNNDITEYKHRPYVFVYAVVLAWMIARLIEEFVPVVLKEKRFAFVLTGLVTCAALISFEGVDPQWTRLAWAVVAQDYHLDKNVLSAACAIRGESHGTDTMVVLGATGEEEMVSASIAEVPQFAVRGGVTSSRAKAETDPVTVSRIGTIHEMLRATSASGASTNLGDLMLANHLRWVITGRNPSLVNDPRLVASKFGERTLVELPPQGDAQHAATDRPCEAIARK